MQVIQILFKNKSKLIDSKFINIASEYNYDLIINNLIICSDNLISTIISHIYVRICHQINFFIKKYHFSIFFLYINVDQ